MSSGLEKCCVPMPRLGEPEDSWPSCGQPTDGVDAIMCKSHWAMVSKDVRLGMITEQREAKRKQADSYGDAWGTLAQMAVAGVIRKLLKNAALDAAMFGVGDGRPVIGENEEDEAEVC